METIRDTFHVYLDSASAIRTGNTYQFPISPSIDVMFPQKGYVYLKEFSGLNNLYNVNENNNTFTVYYQDPNNANLLTNSGLLTLGVGNYATGTLLAAALTALFPANTMTFHFDEPSARMLAFHPTQNFRFEGAIFSDMLSFATDPIYIENARTLALAYRSTTEVDIHKGIHNIYIAIQEIKANNRDVGTALARGSRIAKVPVLTDFGHYIVFQAQAPVVKMVMDEVRINQLHVDIFDDDGIHYHPPRFTLSLVIEIADPVATMPPNPLAVPDAYDFRKEQPVFNMAYPQSCFLRN